MGAKKNLTVRKSIKYVFLKNNPIRQKMNKTFFLYERLGCRRKPFLSNRAGTPPLNSPGNGILK